ncbi:hypothetical protein [Streptomyces sp. NPDC048385]|uniref:hypothetical protein n=1 Tax=unclassified Streptomyces TaxID=2593676 RepID=UPI00341D931F
MISNLGDPRTRDRTVPTGAFPDGTTRVGTAAQKQRLTTPSTGIPGAAYSRGVLDVQGWIGHNGSLPGPVRPGDHPGHLPGHVFGLPEPAYATR